MKRRSVLVVESEAESRAQMADWLEDAGYDVVVCPGPGAPDYTCIGGRGLPCPLAISADLVVLNDHLDSDAMMQGTPGWQLLTYYYELGKPVVSLIDSSDFVVPKVDDRVKTLHRPVDRTTLVKTVEELADAAVR
jgi:CheY-like chemotaxis protein